MSNKYGAKRTWSELCQRTFDSKAECRRGEELHLLEMAGEIRDLEYQVKYNLSEKPKVTITIDFHYYVPDDKDWVWEDAKGVLTRDFRTKMCWLKAKYDIDVILHRR